jgi:hypothetical protein
MPLQGTFDVLGFADVLHLLGRKGMTGRLHLRNRSMGANVYLDDGKLVGADLGEHSTNSAADVHGRLEEICVELLEAERGSFEFLPDTMGMGPATVNLEVDVVLDRARKRLDEWRLIQAVIPSLDLHPQVVDSLPADEVTLSRERWRLITAMDGRRSIRAIARSVGLTEYETCRMVKSLMDEGVVELIGPQRGAAGVSREPVLIVDEEAGEYDESEESESGPAEGSDPWVDRQAMTASPGTASTTTPAVPPPTAQDPPKKGRSGIVRIGKRPRPTAPS